MPERRAVRLDELGNDALLGQRRRWRAALHKKSALRRLGV